MAQIGNLEESSAAVVDCAFKLHKDLGPGLLESAYEMLLAAKLVALGFKIDRQVPINIDYDGIHIENAFRIDMVVDEKLLVEIKSTENYSPVHAKQLLTYLRLTNRPLGLLINFGSPTFREGIRRLVNNHTDFASSRLRANNLGTPP
jgi:GxxExxY protein